MNNEIKQLPDGVYFDLSDDNYRGQRRLSSTSIKNLLISPATFWASSFLNPDKPEREVDKKAYKIGRAYHTARFEPEKMDERFVCEPDKANYTHALITDQKVKEALRDIGAPMTKAGEKAEERGWRLLDMGYEGAVWSCIKSAFMDTVGERETIPADVWQDIKEDANRLKASEDVHKIFYGEGEDKERAQNEVSVLWTDENGLKLMCRFDRLMVSRFVDLKTFANAVGKPLAQNINDAFRYNRYYIQGAFYWHGAMAIQNDRLEVHGTPAQKQLIGAITARDLPLESYFVFQEKSGIPNILAKRFKVFNVHYDDESGDDEHAYRQAVKHNHKSALFAKAEVEINYVKAEFMRYSEVYEAGEPWLPLNAVTDFEDEDFSSYWLEGK